MHNIVVYGPGCAKCTALEDVTKQAVQELHLDASLEKVTDAMQFAVVGVLVTPALAVDGKVLVSGRVPSKDEITKILQETIQADSSRQKSCCCSGATEPALPQENGSQPKEASSCGGSCCGSETFKGSSGWKKAVVWVVVLLILLAIVKAINHRGAENREEPAATTVTMKSGVEAVYYKYGARCPTCIRMETWTKEAIEKNFSGPTYLTNHPTDHLQYSNNIVAKTDPTAPRTIVIIVDKIRVKTGLLFTKSKI